MHQSGYEMLGPDVACSVHLGQMRGALSEMGAPLAAAVLEPSFTAKPCLVHLDVTHQKRAGQWPADREQPGAGHRAMPVDIPAGPCQEDPADG